MARRYAVLRSGLQHAQLISRLEAGFRRLQAEYDLELSYAYAEDDADTRQDVWLEERSEAVLVRLVTYRPIAMNYLVMEAVEPRQLQQITTLIDDLPIQPLAALQASARQRMEKTPTVLIRLAVGAGDSVDRTTLAVLEDALSRNNRAVRLAAAMAAGVTQWPELVPVLETAARRERDERVRRMIEGALACCVPQPDSDGAASDGAISECADGDGGDGDNGNCGPEPFRTLSTPFRGV
jgi:hypothetical protein